MLLSDSVGGAEESRKGLLNSIPVNVTVRVGMLELPVWLKAKG
jgi:hypothetical protein